MLNPQTCPRCGAFMYQWNCQNENCGWIFDADDVDCVDEVLDAELEEECSITINRRSP